MTENNVGKSGLRTLTQDEMNTVSGGVAWLPIIGGILAKVIINTIVDLFNHKDKDMQNPIDPGMPSPSYDPNPDNSKNFKYC